MDGWMDVWMYRCMDGCMYAWMDVCMDGWMDACVDIHGIQSGTISSSIELEAILPTSFSSSSPSALAGAFMLCSATS